MASNASSHSIPGQPKDSRWIPSPRGIYLTSHSIKRAHWRVGDVASTRESCQGGEEKAISARSEGKPALAS